MKKFFLFLVCLSMFVLISCGEESGGDPEQLSDIPDWDYSNAVTDDENNDAENIPEDNSNPGSSETPDSADSENNAQPDESNISDELPDNENSLPQGCGNETVEYGE